jgi:hypothetical protein
VEQDKEEELIIRSEEGTEEEGSGARPPVGFSHPLFSP